MAEKDDFAIIKQLITILEGDEFFQEQGTPAEDASTALAGWIGKTSDLKKKI